MLDWSANSRDSKKDPTASGEDFIAGIDDADVGLPGTHRRDDRVVEAKSTNVPSSEHGAIGQRIGQFFGAGVGDVSTI
jgi:hypothetical protein